ncbi:MAG: hydrogenase maturation factor [Eubacterium sp.]|nr:hydrogenase maturation factor [Eubacterium sp.]
MKTGKIKGNAFERVIKKEFHNRRDDVGFMPGDDAALFDAADESKTLMATETVTHAYTQVEQIALTRAINNLYASGGMPRAVQLAITVPTSYEEAELRKMMRRVDAFCERHHVQLAGGHTEAADAVNAPVVTAVAVGAVKKEEYLSAHKLQGGLELVLAGEIAKEGTLVLLERMEDALREHFTGTFLKRARERMLELSIEKAASLAKKHGAVAMHDLAGGGVFGALWEMADAAGVGLEVDLKAILIAQHSVEICEYAGMNPYEMASSGSVLIAVKDGFDLVEELTQQGIAAAIIGKTTDGNDRILRNGEEIRYLDLPKVDELYKLDTYEK